MVLAEPVEICLCGVLRFGCLYMLEMSVYHRGIDDIKGTFHHMGPACGVGHLSGFALGLWLLAAASHGVWFLSSELAKIYLRWEE